MLSEQSFSQHYLKPLTLVAKAFIISAKLNCFLQLPICCLWRVRTFWEEKKSHKCFSCVLLVCNWCFVCLFKRWLVFTVLMQKHWCFCKRYIMLKSLIVSKPKQSETNCMYHVQCPCLYFLHTTDYCVWYVSLLNTLKYCVGNVLYKVFVTVTTTFSPLNGIYVLTTYIFIKLF